MRFTGIKELKQKTMGVIEACKTEDVIITAYGKPTAILHHITEEDLADYLVENDPLFRSRIEDAYAEYTLAGGLTADALITKLESHRGTKKV
jgi:antitoxin (DNA-binding transcriptional repressor) of toxin-antitoxin stability system